MIGRRSDLSKDSTVAVSSEISMSANSFSRTLPERRSEVWIAIEPVNRHSREPGTAPSGCLGASTHLSSPALCSSRVTGEATKLRRSMAESIRLELNASMVCIEIEMSFCVSPRSIQKSRRACALKPRRRSVLRVGSRRSSHPSWLPDSIDARISEVEKPPNS